MAWRWLTGEKLPIKLSYTVPLCCQGRNVLLRVLLRHGCLPIECREYSSDYVAAEDAAKDAKRGVWAGAFDVPADWRKERKVLKA